MTTGRINQVTLVLHTLNDSRHSRAQRRKLESQGASKLGTHKHSHSAESFKRSSDISHPPALLEEQREHETSVGALCCEAHAGDL